METLGILEERNTKENILGVRNKAIQKSVVSVKGTERRVPQAAAQAAAQAAVQATATVPTILQMTYPICSSE